MFIQKNNFEGLALWVEHHIGEWFNPEEIDDKLNFLNNIDKKAYGYLKNINQEDLFKKYGLKIYSDYIINYFDEIDCYISYGYNIENDNWFREKFKPKYYNRLINDINLMYGKPEEFKLYCNNELCFEDAEKIIGEKYVNLFYHIIQIHKKDNEIISNTNKIIEEIY